MVTVSSGSNSRTRGPRTRRVVVLAVPPIEELDLVGPIQVFSAANRLGKRVVYAVEVATAAKDLRVEGESGLLTFAAQNRYTEVTGEIHSLLLVCGVGTRNARDAKLIAWLREKAPQVQRLGSVCVGSFLLAEAGLLNGKRATSHWKFGQELARRYPQVKVMRDPVWVKDGNIYTSAGISAGIDLALAWVEEDCGNAIASEVARELVLFLRRPAGQPQLSVSLAQQAEEMRSMQELQVWMAENLEKKLSVEILAERTAMSVRNFERVFARETGMTPARYLTQLRVEAAHRMLERNAKSRQQIAALCGFSSADVMRRALRRTARPPRSAE